jgi:pilus assembly protein TadC
MQKNKTDTGMNRILKNLFLGLTIIGFTCSLIYSITYSNQPQNINLVLALPFILFLAPYLFLSLFDIKKIESKVEVIPRFLRDVVDNVESGMDLISAIRVTNNNEYGVLNQDISKLNNQLSWGINFETAFVNFADNVGSSDLKRDFLLVVEARKIGGHVEKILRELSYKILTETLRKKERKSNLSSNTFTGYVSFVIFIFIIILVYNNLFLGLGTNLDPDNVSQNEATTSLTSTYLTLLILLSYELAILSGFLFGLMQENNIIAGAPHVVMLVTIVFIAFFFFIQY